MVRLKTRPEIITITRISFNLPGQKYQMVIFDRTNAYLFAWLLTVKYHVCFCDLTALSTFKTVYFCSADNIQILFWYSTVKRRTIFGQLQIQHRHSRQTCANQQSMSKIPRFFGLAKFITTHKEPTSWVSLALRITIVIDRVVKLFDMENQCHWVSSNRVQFAIISGLLKSDTVDLSAPNPSIR